jgi:hypothetical protein
MKYLISLVLLGLAGVEYYHHVADAHGPGAKTCIAPQARADEARDILMQHLRGHH